MKLQSYIEQAAECLAVSEAFYGHGTANASDEAVYLVYIYLGIDFAEEGDQAVDTRILSAAEVRALDRLLARRIDQRIPVAYLVGKAWFGGYQFYCDERALVPRSPIAELIGNHFQPMLQDYPRRILDLCTGGGSIGIASALQFADSVVELADISVDALALAGENIALHGLESRVSTVRSDLFAGLEGEYDLILCNPPYVSREEVQALPAEYHHEPELGLLSDDHGLELPLHILLEAADYLTAKGILLMEVGHSHQLLADRLPEVPLMWLEFERGGEGVFCLTASQLRQYRGSFA